MFIAHRSRLSLPLFAVCWYSTWCAGRRFPDKTVCVLKPHRLLRLCFSFVSSQWYAAHSGHRERMSGFGIWMHARILCLFVVCSCRSVICTVSSKNDSLARVRLILRFFSPGRVLVAVVLATFGMLVVIPLSVGNNPFRRTSCHVMFSCIVSLAYTL
jgi:hypothetical protein